MKVDAAETEETLAGLKLNLEVVIYFFIFKQHSEIKSL